MKYNNKIEFYYFYRYHRIFFGSLIFRGRKIWAFNFFSNLKCLFKQKERLEPNLFFWFSMLKITPKILLSPLKIGGKLEGAPLWIGLRKKLTYATKWVFKLIREFKKEINNKKIKDEYMDNNYKCIKVTNVLNVLYNALYNKGIVISQRNTSYVIGLKNKYLIKKFK